VYADLLDTPSIVASEPVPGDARLTTEGGVNVALIGTNFGTNRGRLVFRYFSPEDGANALPREEDVNVTLWTPTLVNFTLPAGQGQPQIRLFIPGAESRQATFAFRYAEPVVFSMSGNSGPTNGFLDPTDPATAMVPGGGAPLLFINGSNFGVALRRSSASPDAAFVGAEALNRTRAELGPLENRVLVGSRLCDIVVWSHDLIVCKPPPGVGGANRVSIYLY
jgi:hypothetical protein